MTQHRGRKLGQCQSIGVDEMHRRTEGAQKTSSSQTDAHAASTASFSECSSHLNVRLPRAALLHDPCILMYIIIYLRTYGTDPGTIWLMEPRCQMWRSKHQAEKHHRLYLLAVVCGRKSDGVEVGHCDV